jgi:predicted RNase H-like nuclease (RuvC/YqgF family)
MTTKLELQQSLNRCTAELVELRHTVAQPAGTIESLQLQLAREREDHPESDALATSLHECEVENEDLLKQLAAANARANKFRADFEESQRWVGIWKSKAQLAQARSSEPSERRAAMAAAKAAAIANGHSVKVGA